MDQETSTTDNFEAQLERGREQLSVARDTYSTLELTEDVPDDIIESLGDLEEELDELEQTLEVTSRDIDLAEEIAQQISILAEVLAALEMRQATVVEKRLKRVQAFAGGIFELSNDAANSVTDRSRLNKVDSQLSMLEKLASSGRHGQVVSNNRVSLRKIDRTLRQIEQELSDEVADSTRTETYLSIAQNLLEDIHQTLATLDDENADKTAFSTDLNIVKNKIEAAENADGDEAVVSARTALEGTFMLHQLIATSGAEQVAAKELGNIITTANDELTTDIETQSAQGNIDVLLDEISTIIGAGVKRSSDERLSRLLREHNGSVTRTAEATDFDVSVILEHLNQLYQQQPISDIQVVFEQ